MGLEEPGWGAGERGCELQRTHGGRREGVDVAGRLHMEPQRGCTDGHSGEELGARLQMTRRVPERAGGQGSLGCGSHCWEERSGQQCSGNPEAQWSSHFRVGTWAWAVAELGGQVCLQAQGTTVLGFLAASRSSPLCLPHGLRPGLGPKVTLSE